MGHLIDMSKGKAAFVAFKAPGWHGLGEVFHEEITAAQALERAMLDFTVLKLPNVHCWKQPDEDGKQRLIEIYSEDSFFTIRTDVWKVLGSKLGRDYTPLQNIEALNVVDDILASGTCTIESAGAIDEGRKVFICLKVKQDILVGSADLIKQYCVIVTSHDGSLSTTVMFTNIRVVCNNTLTAALRGAGQKIKIRHTSGAQERLSEAAKVLKLITINTAVNEDNYNQMKEQVISNQEMWSYFGQVFCTPKEIADLQAGKHDAIKTKKRNIIDGVNTFAHTGDGSAMAKQGGDLTMWSAYNGITGYLTHKNYTSVNDRANNLMFGTAAETIERAGVLALDKAKLQAANKIKFNFNFN